jgi:transposase-like protein
MSVEANIIDDEFRVKAVRFYMESGFSLAKSAQHFGIHLNTMRRWSKLFGTVRPSVQDNGEVARLRQQVAELQLLCDALRRTTVYFAKAA